MKAIIKNVCIILLLFCITNCKKEEPYCQECYVYYQKYLKNSKVPEIEFYSTDENDKLGTFCGTEIDSIKQTNIRIYDNDSIRWVRSIRCK